MMLISRSAVLKLSLLLLFLALNPAAQAQASYSGTVDFGTVNVGNSSGTQTLTFSFSSPTALNVSTPVQVLTTGISGLDFKNAGTGSCASSTYSSCTVDVTFTPGAPGVRRGAVVIEDATGNVLATAYIHGLGMGPQITFNTGTQTTVGVNMLGPGASAVDAAGNVYIADTGGNEIFRVAPDGTQTRLPPFSGISGPVGIAVDGAGNYYIANSGTTGQILKLTPAGVQTNIGSGFSGLGGIAIDGLGNLYVADTAANSVLKFTPDGVQTSIGTGLFTPSGVAVDAVGNVYIADTQNYRIVKVTPGGTQTVITGGSPLFPESVAVDTAGNIYVADAGTGKAFEYSPTGVLIRTLASTLNFPVGINVDDRGNVYIAQGSTLIKLDRSTPPTIGFVTGTFGVTTPDSPRSITVEDDGNATLSFPAPSSGTNPAITPADFTLDSTTTCPELTSSSSAATLAIGASCVYAIDYKPSTTSLNTGSMIITDNNLNATNATQSIILNNQGVPVIIAATVTVPPFTTGTVNGVTPYVLPITTDPAGLTLTVTYDNLLGSDPATTSPPTQPGFYLVTAVVNQAGYSGSGSGYLSLSSPAPTVITWANPANITVGTPLSATQLNATASTPGTFTYSPALGTLLAVGTYPLNVTFTPTDTTDYLSSSATVTLVVTGNTQTVTPINFGKVNIGSTSVTQTVTFNFLNPATLGGSTPVQVLTQGIAGLDFKNTNAGTCAAGSYGVNAACTVTVSFAPAAPGLRSGAVVLQDASGNVVATTFIGGVGQGPEIAYDPGVQSTIDPGVVTDGVAIDPAGNVYLNMIAKLVKLAPDGTQTTLTTGITPGFVSNGNTAIDGAGNIYVLDFVNSIVWELTPSGAIYQVGSNFKNPADIAIDAAGNLYIVDVNYSQVFGASNGRVVEITSAGVQSTIAGPFVYPEGVAVDAAGNVYISDNAGLGTGSTTPMGLVYKIVPGGATSVIASGLLSPAGVAVDAAGNVFVAGATDSTVDKITPDGTVTTFASGLSFPGSLRMDSFGSLYLPHATQNAELVKIDRSTPPAFSFASTSIGSTSSDSPQSATIENIGTTSLNFPAIGTGTNASISTNFQFADATTCPDSATASTLISGASCIYSVAFVPTTTGPINGSLTLTDNALNVANTTQVLSLSGTGSAGTPTTATVTLGGLTQTYTGSPLSATATTSPAGLSVALTYNGNATPPTAAGSYAVVATVTTSGYTGTAMGTMVIAQTTPMITWPTPAGISSGTALSATQLNATASVGGTFAYTPAAGTVPAIGTDTLSVTFTPTDTVDYKTVTATVSLSVGQITPVITWATPSAISYGTALSGAQLNATASVAGSFAYTPAAGTVLTAGSYTLSAVFTPTDTTDYSGATKTVSITVSPATLTLTANNASKVYGTANPAFTGSLTGTQNGDNLTESFTTSAGTLSNVGMYSIVPSVVGSNLTSYTQMVTDGSLSITQAGSTTALTVSSTSISSGDSVTLNAQVASATSGTPTGSVQFYDGTTLLNTATLNNGVANYSTTTLAAGTADAITAVYLGDTNFTGSNNGAAETVTVGSAPLDFSLTPITLTNTLTSGGTASYTFQITPANGLYPSSVTFTASGLPSNATATFSPATIPADGGVQTVTVNIQTTAAAASGFTYAPIALGLILLPFAGARRLRRSRKFLACIVCLGLLFVVGLSGCGGGNGQTQKTYTVTLTATSGTIQHSTTVVLNVP